MNTEERELSWDDEIQKDDNFELLPDGDYDFTVKSFTRSRHNGSEKLPPCNKAEVTITVWGRDYPVDIKHNFFLHTKCEGMISAFYVAIGLKKHGEKLKMNWNAVIGLKGKCKVYIESYTKKDSKEGKSNKIKKFYSPDDKVQTLSPQPSASGSQSDNKWGNISW